jgi:hypothetical protein
MPSLESGGRRWNWCSVWSSEPRRAARAEEDNARPGDGTLGAVLRWAGRGSGSRSVLRNLRRRLAKPGVTGAIWDPAEIRSHPKNAASSLC